MDRSVWLEPSTAGASLQRCLYADAVMLVPLLCDRAEAMTWSLPKRLHIFVIHCSLKIFLFSVFKNDEGISQQTPLPYLCVCVCVYVCASIIFLTREQSTNADGIQAVWLTNMLSSCFSKRKFRTESISETRLCAWALTHVVIALSSLHLFYKNTSTCNSFHVKGTQPRTNYTFNPMTEFVQSKNQ